MSRTLPIDGARIILKSTASPVEVRRVLSQQLHLPRVRFYPFSHTSTLRRTLRITASP
jgi:hypothetical protein